MFQLIYPYDPAPFLPLPTAEHPGGMNYAGGEMVPIVEPSGLVIGQTARSLAHGGTGLLHPVVHLHVINRNLVKRVNNPKDKRQNLIKVTEYSKTVKDAVTAISYEAVQKIINGIPREELESFVRTIARMQKNIDKDSDLEELGRKYPTNPGGAI